MKIAYVLGTYPYLTTTFVDREILEVQRRGVELVLVSMRKPSRFETSAEIRNLAQATKYLLPAPWPRLLAAHLCWVLTRPLAYLTTLIRLLTRPHPGFGAWIRSLFYFTLGVRAAELLRGESIDHIHAHFASRPTVVAMVVSRLLGIPYSMFAHAYDIYKAPVMLSEKIDRAKFVATCTAYNKAHLECLDGGRFVDKVHLVYHGLDLSMFVPCRATAADIHSRTATPCDNGQPGDRRPPLLLSVGQLREKKGFPYLIRACRLLVDHGYDFRCEIIGEGPERPGLEALIADLNLERTVLLRGALPHSQVIASYARATLFVLACTLAQDGDRDGIPNVLLEAMAMQLPVVSTQLSGIPEAVQDGLTGLLIPSMDEEALAAALARLLDDPELQRKLGRQGRKRVEEQFEICRNVSRLIALFEEP